MRTMVWVLVVFGGSVTFSVIVGRLLEGASATYPAAPGGLDDATATALTDGVTTLANRRRLDRDLPAALGRGPVGFLIVDVDHFATYHEAHGRAAGDDALRRVAQVLARQVRPTDIVYRYGTEQFCVLLADTTPVEAASVAERMRAGVEAVDFPGAESLPSGRITVSVGLAITEATDPVEVTQAAGRALHAAKDGGRNRVEISPLPA